MYKRQLFYVRDILQEGNITIHFLPTELHVADIGEKILSKHRHRYLIDVINNFKA